MTGNVRLRIECLMPEQLLRRAVARGAGLKGVRRPNARTLLVDTDEDGANRLLDLCRRFSIPARVVRRTGASACRNYLRRRLTLPLGLLLGVALCAMCLGRIWRVDVAFTGDAATLGNAALFETALGEMGIRPGASRRIDGERLAQALQARAEDYSFVGVRVQGVRLLVEAAPELPAPPVYDVDAARDLVARRDGIVVSANARAGALCVKPGDTVRRGQLLIRGEEQATRDVTRPIAALGEVVIRTWVEGAASLPLNVVLTRPTGQISTASALRAMALSWPITRGTTYASQQVDVETLPIGGLYLPIEIVRETRRETETRLVAADRAELEARLIRLATADAALNLARGAFGDFEIARTWIESEPDGAASLRARAVIELTTDAAVSREALLQGG